jgi:hypothetical protein
VSDVTEWELCELEADSEASLRDAYLAIYVAEYVQAEVRDWSGRRILFHRPTFDHAFSESSNYRTGAGVHDVSFSLPRAQRIYWIGKALSADGVDIDVIGQIRKDNRGRPRRRRTLIVIDNRYVVVLQLSERDGYDFEFVTAFPASAAYLVEIRRDGALVEKRRHKKMPQSCGD